MRKASFIQQLTRPYEVYQWIIDVFYGQIRVFDVLLRTPFNGVFVLGRQNLSFLSKLLKTGP